jgi:hypothetical protein
VILGAHDIYRVESSQQRQIVYPGGFRVHKNYDRIKTTNDIALIILPEKITFNENVAKIDLPWSYVDNQFVGSTVIMTGWGVIFDITRDDSSVLRFSLDTIVSNTECEREHPDYLDSMICNSAARGRNSCQGELITTFE